MRSIIYSIIERIYIYIKDYKIELELGISLKFFLIYKLTKVEL